MTRTFATFALLALVACAPRPVPDAGLRDAAVPIRSVALFQQSQLAGSWHEVAGFGAGCRGGRLQLDPAGTAGTADACHLPLPAAVRLVASGPGRFTAGGIEFWVLWIDADSRTAVIGTPSGAFGAILNRDAAIPQDRLVAARRVLEFNGYDLGRLEG